jgi:hypothetical protein
VLLKLAEYAEVAVSVAKMTAENFNSLPYNVREQLLLKLAENAEVAVSVAKMTAENFNSLPYNVREQLLLKLADNGKSAAVIAKIIGRNFNSLPYNVREQLLLKLADNDKAVGDLAIAITSNFNSLPPHVQQLLFKLAEKDDKTAAALAEGIEEYFITLPLNVQEELLLKLADKYEVAEVSQSLSNIIKRCSFYGREFPKDITNKLPEEIRKEIIRHRELNKELRDKKDYALPVATVGSSPYLPRPKKKVAKAPLASKPSSRAEEQTLERYPYGRFPSEVILESVVPLDIVIKTTQTTTDTEALKITSKKGESEVPVEVVVDSGTFEIQGRNYYATILVPVEPKDSIPVTFFLKAKKGGQQTINVRFFQQGTFLGKLTINTFVVTSRAKIIVSNIWNRQPQPQTISAGWHFPRTILPGADITLYIIERPDGQMKYDILLSSAEFPIRGLGPIPFKEGNPEAKFRSLIEDIEKDLTLPANVLENRIKAKGRMLYDEIFPEAFKILYWEKRDSIESIRVISAEPWIPWEIIKPYRTKEDGRIEEDPFLCERYSFSRWLQDIPDKAEDRELKKVVIVAPSHIGLEQADQETKWVKQFASYSGLEIEEISAYEEMINVLENDEFDLLHLTSHGFYNPDHSSLSSLKLENGGEIGPDEISGTYASFGRFKPVVILNACQTGALGFSLTKTMGWSKTFIGAGSSVFIGTAWSVTDQGASKFVQFLYAELAKGTTLGEAVKMARNYCKTTGDPSWLAYQLYGHPHIQIKFGQG